MTTATNTVDTSPGSRARSKNAAESLGHFAVWTPEIELLARAILGWIALDLPGACVHGIQRTGKTWAIDYILASASEFFSTTFFLVRIVIPENLPDRGNMLTAEWLIQHGVIANTRDPARLKKRLMDWLREMMQAASAERLLLFVDEAQNLTRAHHGQLMYWHNIFEDAGARPFTLLVGQPELGASAVSYVQMNELQVTGRFYERMHEFQGIACGDVIKVLRAFQQPTVLDGMEQPCGLAQVFPNHWANGWRVEAWAPSIVAAVQELSRARSLPKVPRIPMMHLRALIIGGLDEMKRTGKCLDALPKDLLDALMKRSGFTKSIDLYAQSRPKPAKGEKS
jgi:hypothetical protein